MSDLRSIIQGYLDRHRILFWYDQEQTYSEEFEQLELEDVQKINGATAPFRLKYRLLKEMPEARVLVYLPYPQPTDEENWLLDLTLRYAAFQADDASLLLTELNLDESLRPHIARYTAFLRNKERKQALTAYSSQISDSQSLAEAMIAILLKCDPDPFHIILESIRDTRATDSHWEEIVRYGLAEEYLEYVRQYFDITDTQIESVDELIIYLFRHYDRIQCKIFIDKWRHHQQYFELYRAISDQVYRDVIRPEKSKDTVYPVNDLYEQEERDCITRMVGVLSTSGDITAILDQLKPSQGRFWYPHFRSQYNALEHAAALYNALMGYTPEKGFDHTVAAYQDDHHRIDFHYRKAILALNALQPDASWSALRENVSARYEQEFLEPLNEELSMRIKHKPSELLSAITQPGIYATAVAPTLRKQQKIALIISDALRYEAGVELNNRINGLDRYESTVSMEIAQIPTYTQMGMASLLPAKDLELKKNGTVACEHGATVGTQNREKIYQEAHQASMCILASEFIKMTSGEAREVTSGSDLLVVYSNIIDATGDDKQSEQNTFEAVEKELQNLIDALKRAANCNYTHILITADHGFIYREHSVLESEKITEYAKLPKARANRRYIFTESDPQDARLICIPPDELGYQSAFHLCFPSALNVFKVAGSGTRYLHGGLSIQELAIPFLTISKKRTKEYDTQKVALEVTSIPTRITSYSPIVKVLQKDPIGDKIVARDVRLGFYDRDGNELSNIEERQFAIADPEIRNREIAFRFHFSNQVTRYFKSEIYFRIADRYKDTSEYVDYLTLPVEVFLSEEKDFEL